MNKSDNNCHAIYLAIIFAVTTALFWNSLNGDFIWDDRGLVLDNTTYLSNWKNLYEGFYKPFFGDTPYYRPLLTGSFIIDYHLWGSKPFGYHCTNVLLHICNALLVYLFVLLLLKQSKLALSASLLFAAHPVQSEAVAWISGRNDVLLTFFALSSIILHLYWKRFQGWLRVLFYASYLFCYMGALFTKESALVLPLLLVLIDYYYQDNRRYMLQDYAGLLIISVAYYFTRIIIIGETGIGVAGGELSDTLSRIIATYAYYFRTLLFPAFQSSVPDITGAVSGGHYLIYACLLLTCLAAIAIFSTKRCKEIPFSMLWVFISLIPVCGMFPLSIPALEHRLYLGTVCFSMLLPCAAFRLSCIQTPVQKLYKTRRAVVLLLPAVLLIYSAKTVTRNNLWNNELSLWMSTVHDSPRSAVARNNLGIAYARAGNHQMAIREFKRGLELHDRQGNAAGLGSVQRAKIFNNLGQCYYQLLLTRLPSEASSSSVDAQGSKTIKRLYALSRYCYQKALDNNPANNEARNNLNDLFFVKKNFPVAEEEFRITSSASHGQL